MAGRSGYQKQEREVRKEQQRLLYMREMEEKGKQGKGERGTGLENP